MKNTINWLVFGDTLLIEANLIHIRNQNISDIEEYFKSSSQAIHKFEFFLTYHVIIYPISENLPVTGNKYLPK